jgi:hypothetical protein
MSTRLPFSSGCAGSLHETEIATAITAKNMIPFFIGLHIYFLMI